MTRSALPPRFVPTLTEVVQAAPSAVSPAPIPQTAPAAADLMHTQEQMVHRVMQRVDLTLDRLLRETVGRVVLAHTQTLAPSLRDEIEIAIRQSVNEAFEQELAIQLAEKY
ncbi:MAG TPA: hypothetical protein VE934_09850 [Polaromonas sp.]|uniref:hypothetical protein n=1 Tax=Polaromonas sp. TaxID=1869339 RepID=UPI002D6A11C9|nr:hypothetical protein [Polaromonas sp.]HYW57255.1 hypothetical protein [Polaromonas sp.]